MLQLPRDSLTLNVILIVESNRIMCRTIFQILYVGDHIYGDILRSKKVLGMLFYHLFIALEFDIYLIIKYMAVLIVQMSFGAAHYFTMCRRNILACSVIDLFLLKFMFVCHCSLEFVTLSCGAGAHTKSNGTHPSEHTRTHKSKCHTYKVIVCLELVCAPLS